MANVRVDQVILETNVTQAANLRVDAVLAEALTNQAPHWRVDAVTLEPYVNQPCNLRVDFVMLEVFCNILGSGPMATAIFPSTLMVDAGWSVHRRPTRSTRRAQSVSGREVTSPFWIYPLREFELTFEGLNSAASQFQGLAPALKQALDGFWNQVYGGAVTFLFDDEEDDTVTNGKIGTGDGVTTTFPLVRYLGTWAEPVGQVNTISQIAVNGTPTVAYTILQPNAIVFTSAPAAGAAITGSFTYYWQCRFKDEFIDFEEFVNQLHAMGSLKFQTVKP